MARWRGVTFYPVAPHRWDRRGCYVGDDCKTQEEDITMSTRLLGIALIILGVVAFAYQGITYTTQEKVIDVGPLKATVEKEKTIPLPPIVGAAALIGGINTRFPLRRSQTLPFHPHLHRFQWRRPSAGMTVLAAPTASHA